VSREHLQDQKVIQRINSVVTKRILKEFRDLLKNDPAAYDAFFDEFGIFIKEGVCTDMRYKEDLGALLRLDSSLTPQGLISLDTYVDRMKEKQQEIYYLHVANRHMAETSPYYESFKRKGIEVLFLYTLADEVVMQNLVDYRSKRLTSVESAHIDLSLFPDDPSVPKPEQAAEGESADKSKLTPEQLAGFCSWLKDTALSGKVSEVKVSDRLVETPVLIADYEGAQMRRMMKYVDPQGAKTMTLPLQKLHINATHPLIVKLALVRDTNSAVAKLAMEQLFDNALVTAGLMDDSRAMLPRINKILEQMVTNKKD
jgi:TNF receptor-associated protein 1